MTLRKLSEASDPPFNLVFEERSLWAKTRLLMPQPQAQSVLGVTSPSTELAMELCALQAEAFNTSDSFRPTTSEALIAVALFPYPTGLVIATKGGMGEARPQPMDPQRQSQTPH